MSGKYGTPDAANNRRDMPRYEVVLTRDATESVVVEVEADSVSHAEAVALDRSGKHGDGIGGWELDEGNQHFVYTTGVDRICEKEEQCCNKE